MDPDDPTRCGRCGLLGSPVDGSSLLRCPRGHEWPSQDSVDRARELLEREFPTPEWTPEHDMPFDRQVALVAAAAGARSPERTEKFGEFTGEELAALQRRKAALDAADDEDQAAVPGVDVEAAEALAREVAEISEDE